MRPILVLASFDLEAIPVIEWAAEHGQVWAVLGGNAINDRSGVRARQQLEQCTWTWVRDIAGDGRTVTAALEWSHQVDFEAVVCLDEQGLQLAAQLRELLGVKHGQLPASAQAYRVKDTMAHAVASAGIPVPDSVVVDDPAGLALAARELGLPLVVKPRDGMGTQGVRVLRCPTELDETLTRTDWSVTTLLAQRYVAGQVLHVDAFFTAAGELVAPIVSAYGAPPLDSLLAARPLVSGMLPGSSPLARQAKALTARLCGALPDPAGSAIHAELFHTTNGELVFGEIASRTGGAGVAGVYRHATAANLFQLHALAQLGAADDLDALVRPLLEWPPADPQPRYGWYLEPPAQGTLVSLAEHCPLPQVVEYRPFGRIGHDYSGPSSSVACVQRFIVRLDLATPEAPEPSEAPGDAFDGPFAEIAQWCRATTTWG